MRHRVRRACPIHSKRVKTTATGLAGASLGETSQRTIDPLHRRRARGTQAGGLCDLATPRADDSMSLDSARQNRFPSVLDLPLRRISALESTSCERSETVHRKTLLSDPGAP